MGILGDQEIKKAVEDGSLVIEPYVEDMVKPASIDLTLGSEAFRASDDDKLFLEEGDVLKIPAAETALVLTRERIEMGSDLAGSIGLRSSFSRRGIDLLAGPQIDPGFRGPLHVFLINLSPSEIIIEFGEPFLTVEIHRLDEPVESPYDGRFQELDHITAEEMRDIREGEGIALSEAVKAMRNIARDVNSMEETVESLSKEMKWQMRFVVALLGALVIGILGSLIGVI